MTNDKKKIPPTTRESPKDSTFDLMAMFKQLPQLLNTTTKTERRSIMSNMDFSNNTIITHESISVILKDYQINNFIVDQSMNALLSAFLVEYCTLTAQNKSDRIITLSLTDYMERRGIKDRKEAKKRAIRDLDAIDNIGFSELKRFNLIRLSQQVKIQGDTMTLWISEPFSRILEESYVIPYPKQLWKLNPKDNPNSFYLLRFMAEHKNMNYFKDNADIFLVSTLLVKAVFIPTAEEIGNERHYTRRIIEPFERDLNALSDTLSWHYQDREGNKIDKVESYKQFVTLRVHVTWNDYPEKKKIAPPKKRNTKK